MPKFRVFCWITLSAQVVVEAKNAEEAKKIADDLPEGHWKLDPRDEWVWEDQTVVKLPEEK
jgi:hypothetical protein